MNNQDFSWENLTRLYGITITSGGFPQACIVMLDLHTFAVGGSVDKVFAVLCSPLNSRFSER
jgi:hypothetical protein